MFAYRSAMALILACVSCEAAALTWPGVAPPCDTTLQACIAGAPIGATIEVATSEVIPAGPSIFLQQPVKLIAAPGFRPVLPRGTSIFVSYDSPQAAAWNTTIAGFALRDGGVSVVLRHGQPHIDVHDLDIESEDPSESKSPVIEVTAVPGVTASTDIARNRFRIATGTATALRPAIRVDGNDGSSMAVRIHDNRVIGLGPAGIGGIQTHTSGHSTVAIYSNQVSGFVSSGIFVSARDSHVSLHMTIVSNAIQCGAGGQGVSLERTAPGTEDAQIFNNTIVGCATGFGTLGAFAGELTGRFANNLLAYNDYGLVINNNVPGNGEPIPNDHNLLFGNNHDLYTPGTGTLTSEPLLSRSVADARLTGTSPAIGAGDGAALRSLLAARGIPEIDADGLRRFKGSDGVVDIGAFEHGDVSFDQRIKASNSSGSLSALDHPALNGIETARPLITATRMSGSYPALTNPHLTSTDYGANHLLRNLDGVSLMLGSAYQVFVPAVGDGVLLHTSMAANVSGFATQINDPAMNGKPDRIVLAAHRGAGFAHPFGIRYFSGSWFLFQSDATAGDVFPINQSFHVYAQDPSINAFHWFAADAGASTYTMLDQLLINHEPCASIQVQAGYNAINPSPTGLRYVSATGRWRIENLDGAIMPTNADFYVVVDEAATVQCRYDHIFHSEFSASN